MKPDKHEIVFTLLAAANRVEGRLNRVLANVKGVSFTEYSLLKQLRDSRNGSATRVDLASAVHLTPSAVTRALKPLEKIGYVSTQKGERDARQSLAVLSSAGEELLRDADQLVADEIAALSIPESMDAETFQVLKSLGSINH